MKTATIPSLRVEPELREAAEKALEHGETLSGFVEQALREKIQRRRLQSEFIARGLASLEEAMQTGEYFTHDEILADLDAIIEEAERKAGK